MGDQRTPLGEVTITDDLSVLDEHLAVIAVDGEVTLDDVTVEVGYDGVVQSLDVESGEIDAGPAQPLYEPEQHLAASCDAEATCALMAPPDSPLRPDRQNFDPSWLSLSPYVEGLGWAEEGTLWASVQLQLFGVLGVADRAGGYRRVRSQEPAVITLDGADPVRNELEGSRARDLLTGSVVFSVSDTPRALRIERSLVLDGQAEPATLPVSLTLDLEPVEQP